MVKINVECFFDDIIVHKLNITYYGFGFTVVVVALCFFLYDSSASECALLCCPVPKK